MNPTFLLLSAAICSVWLNDIKWEKKAIPVWSLLFFLSILCGFISGFIQAYALIFILIFWIIARLTKKTDHHTKHILYSILTFILALALALHRIPGFINPTLISHVQITNDAAPFTLYANFDKASAGLILLSLFCKRSHSPAEWKEVFKRIIPITLFTAFGVFTIAVLTHFVKLEFKLPSFTSTFLIVNLLFTCVAEEAFFRGCIQERLQNVLATTRSGQLASICISALLFGLAHIAGGYIYMTLATCAGLGYAYSYAVVRRIEAPILVHFLFNSLHFLCFTYPNILEVTQLGSLGTL